MSQASPKQRGRYRLHPAAGVEVDDAPPCRRCQPARADGTPAGTVPAACRPHPHRARWRWRVRSRWSSQTGSDRSRTEPSATPTPPSMPCMLRGFLAVLSRRGVTLVEQVTANHVLAWCRMRSPQANGEPNENTMRARRSAARAFFETCACLGITDLNPAKTVEFPGRSGRHVSAFTDNDIRQLQRISGSVLGDTRTPCALALVMSGASTQEMVRHHRRRRRPHRLASSGRTVVATAPETDGSRSRTSGAPTPSGLASLNCVTPTVTTQMASGSSTSRTPPNPRRPVRPLPVSPSSPDC